MFYSDKPIDKKQEDILNRKYFAELIAKTLVEFENTDTFTIGLYGKWGNGKTSLVNMMLQEIDEYQNGLEKLIIVRFEPWNFSSTEQLLEQFFVRLRTVFLDSKDKKLAEVGEALETYSDALNVLKYIPHLGDTLSFLGKKGITKLGRHLKKGLDEKDIIKQKDNVINLLANQDKRILIVIDDIDRLDNEQIRQIFQLITSVAKFPNTTYLLVFDKEVVVKALAKVQEGNGEEYLEKIIQMPIQIPDIQKNEFRKVLFSRLNKMIQDNKVISFEEEYWQIMFDECVNSLLTNLRDINRLCNSMQFKLSAMSTEVNFIDLLVISIIEIKWPYIFEWIKANKIILTGEFDANRILARKKTKEEQYDFYFSELKGVVEYGNEEEKYVKKVLDILARLFPKFGNKIGMEYETYNVNLLRKNNRIGHPEKFERYFDLNIDYVTLKSCDISTALNEMNSNELAEYIVELDKENLSYDFLEEIKAFIDSITEYRAKTIIKAIFNCAYKLDMVQNRSILSNSSRHYGEHLVLLLFERIEIEKRMVFWNELIIDGDFGSLPAIAEVINMIELAYGRLAANGQERHYEKIITIEELICLEKSFVKKIKEILSENSIFDFASYRMILYLMESFEAQFTEIQMKKELQSNRNVLLYLSNTISTWIGSGKSYEVSKEYEKRISKERILEVIQQERKTKTMFELPLDNQRLCAAFYLNEYGHKSFDNHISQKEVDGLLDKWRLED